MEPEAWILPDIQSVNGEAPSHSQYAKHQSINQPSGELENELDMVVLCTIIQQCFPCLSFGTETGTPRPCLTWRIHKRACRHPSSVTLLLANRNQCRLISKAAGYCCLINVCRSRFPWQLRGFKELQAPQYMTRAKHINQWKHLVIEQKNLHRQGKISRSQERTHLDVHKHQPNSITWKTKIWTGRTQPWTSSQKRKTFNITFLRRQKMYLWVSEILIPISIRRLTILWNWNVDHFSRMHIYAILQIVSCIKFIHHHLTCKLTEKCLDSAMWPGSK